MDLDAFSTGPGEPYYTESAALVAQTPIDLGQPGVPHVVLACSRESVTVPFTSAFNTTAFERVLLQAYPSGGCDMFVNGRLVARARPRGPQPWPDSVRIAVGGRSYRADILIGEFRVWQGIVARAEHR